MAKASIVYTQVDSVKLIYYTDEYTYSNPGDLPTSPYALFSTSTMTLRREKKNIESLLLLKSAMQPQGDFMASTALMRVFFYYASGSMDTILFDRFTFRASCGKSWVESAEAVDLLLRLRIYVIENCQICSCSLDEDYAIENYMVEWLMKYQPKYVEEDIYFYNKKNLPKRYLQLRKKAKYYLGSRHKVYFEDLYESINAPCAPLTHRITGRLVPTCKQ